MSKHNHGQEFREQGYTIARSFFNAAEMDTFISAIKEAAGTARSSGLNKGGLIFYNNSFSRSQKVRELISLPRVIDFLSAVIGPDFWVRWDQTVTKAPGAGEFPWHQDNAYNKLEDEHFQLWIALSKMNNERGGLWLVPGSHKRGPLPHAKMGNHLAYVGPTDNKVCIDAEVGDLVLFSSRMLHYTSPNVSKYDRWAYVAEIMSLDHFDPDIKPPYFVLARNGKPHPEFVNFFRGRLRPANFVKYGKRRVKNTVKEARSLAGRGFREVFPKKKA
jgi:ectoine hydroxylase-related dioxygenase (phytanoyl-CoA dioxygenase family)